MNLGSLIPWRGKSQIPVVQEDYVDPFTVLRSEFDQTFREISNAFANGDLWPAGAGWSRLAPALDVRETDDEVVVRAELPGLDEKDFEVTLAGDILTIRGEKKAEREAKNGGAHYVERRFGAFSRAIRLPFEAGDEAVDARYEKGVLTVRVPKPAQVRSAVRHIEVKSS